MFTSLSVQRAIQGCVGYRDDDNLNHVLAVGDQEFDHKILDGKICENQGFQK